MKIPLKDGTDYTVTDLEIEMLQKKYPSINVSQQMRELLDWNLTNPRKRKTERGMPNHIRNWMVRAVERVRDKSPYHASHRIDFTGASRERIERDPEVARKSLAEAKRIMGMRV